MTTIAIILITVLAVTLIAFVELMPGCRRARHRWARWALMAEMGLAFSLVMGNAFMRLAAATSAASVSTAQFSDAMVGLGRALRDEFDDWADWLVTE